MRRHYQKQYRFDATPIASLQLNFDCRDEIVPILAGLQFIYTNNELRNKIVKLVAQDLSKDARRDVGRPALDDWQVVVLAAVRLGCNLDYDKLHDQAENHRALRALLCIGDWDDTTSLTARRIRETLCLLRPGTIAAINQAIVDQGQQLDENASKSVRADSFVVETNIHFPTESSLIWDGVRKFVPLCVELADELAIAGWRQIQHLTLKIKRRAQEISRISASKSPQKKDRVKSAYSNLLGRVGSLLARAKNLLNAAKTKNPKNWQSKLTDAINHWVGLTNQVCGTARRRVLLGERVSNCEKLFSMFETHTQLYQRGKAGELNQFGRLFLVYEDGAGFISHYHLMDRNAQDPDVIVEQTKRAQKKHRGKIETASFDRGFYSQENEKSLSEVIENVCVPPRNPTQYAQRISIGSIEFHQTRKRHSGIESAIAALQSGNGLKRCRDRSELGFERYLGLAILGRNIHVLGKLLIARCNATAAAATTKRQAA